MAKLVSYRWPGNLAELASVVGRAALLCPSATVASSYVTLTEGEGNTSSDSSDVAASGVALPVQLDDLERRELCSALERCGGNKAEVARLLGIQRTTLYYRLKRLGIEV
jgi:two-component system response regulator AtoC/two-component system response regulator HupR/HoxA